MSEIEKALIEIGFEKIGNYFEKDDIKIRVRNCSLSEVMDQLIKFGSTQKIWEIKGVLEI